MFRFGKLLRQKRLLSFLILEVLEGLDL